MIKNNTTLTVEIKVKMIADFSLLTAIKLRIAGGKYIQEYVKEMIKKEGVK